MLLLSIFLVAPKLYTDKTFALCVHYRTIHHNQNLKITQVSKNRKLEKETLVFIQNGLLLSLKKCNTMKYAETWTDHANKVNQKEMERKNNLMSGIEINKVKE